MNRFGYTRVTTLDAALELLGQHPGSRFIAGGTDLVPLMRDSVVAPTHLIDISRIPDLDRIDFSPETGLRLGALTRLVAIAEHPVIRELYGVLSQAISESASPQIRNMATIGGNLLQKPRCAFYRDTVFPCLRRDSGDTCTALEGDNARHALFGGANKCIAVYPSDSANALATLDAVVHLLGPMGERTVPISAFYVPPSIDPTRETVIAPDEIITAISTPPPPVDARGTYVKLRDRAAYEFAIVSAAAVIGTIDGVVSHARLALGGVAWGPYRVPLAEAVLLGQPLNAESIAHAARIALADAQPLEENGYKIPMAQAALRRAIAGDAPKPILLTNEVR